MKCPLCNNPLTWDKKEAYEPCEYCIWKGPIGPGKQLRAIVKEVRDGSK